MNRGSLESLKPSIRVRLERKARQMRRPFWLKPQRLAIPRVLQCVTSATKPVRFRRLSALLGAVAHQGFDRDDGNGSHPDVDPLEDWACGGD